MADLDGRTFLITGANTGIGRATTEALAARGATVYMACRSEARARPVRDAIATATGNDNLHVLALDLADLASVRACVDGKRGMTASGFELAFGTNHVGPFLLTSLLLDRLRASAPARIVTVSSEGHYRVDAIDYDAVRSPTRTRTAFHEYCVSKFANVLHSQELGRRLEGSGVTTYSLHPGTIASDVWREVPWPIRPLLKLRMRSPAEGAKTSIYCATSPDVAGETGLYYDDCRRKEPSRHATPERAAELWERSEAWGKGA
jgi:retinol dehydrogenase 12